MDGVVDGGGCCGDGVLARTMYEWENGGGGTGKHVFGTRLSEIWAPPSPELPSRPPQSGPSHRAKAIRASPPRSTLR